jgi:transcriptional regulator with XRE-family HTH domain
MPQTQRRSRKPLSQRAKNLAIDVIAKAAAMGVVAEPSDYIGLGEERVLQFLREISKAGIARSQINAFENSYVEDDQVKFLTKASEILEESPAPQTEWEQVIKYVPQDPVLTHLLNISKSSIQRYISGERETPREVADRLHVIALIIGDLKSSYNDIGIGSWFNRPRANAFAGKRPVDLLSGDWAPSDPKALKVREFARSLKYFLAT